MKNPDYTNEKEISFEVIDDCILPADTIRSRQIISEGIDIDFPNRTVAFNPKHEEYVDTSLEHNPVLNNDIANGVEVWSIFTRTYPTRPDGNPLIYAMKGESGWKFKTPRDKWKIERQFVNIASKYLESHPCDVTISVPSTNELNNYIAKVVMSTAGTIQYIQGVICKLTTDEVYDIVTQQGSEFERYYKKRNLEEALKKLGLYLDEMDETKNGQFVRHMVKDLEMRNVLKTTMKVSSDTAARYANKINDKNLLIIDDTIRNGDSIRETIAKVNESFFPKSISVLTLFSRLS